MINFVSIYAGNYRLRFFFDDIKWLFLIVPPSKTFVVASRVANQSWQYQRSTDKVCTDVVEPLYTRQPFYDEAALGSEQKKIMSTKSHFAAGLENLAHWSGNTSSSVEPSQHFRMLMFWQQCLRPIYDDITFSREWISTLVSVIWQHQSTTIAFWWNRWRVLFGFPMQTPKIFLPFMHYLTPWRNVLSVTQSLACRMFSCWPIE